MDKETLDSIKARLTDIANILYQGNVIDGMAHMSNVIPDIAVIAETMPDEETRQELINNALAPLLDAMEQKDGTLMADIISYELIPLLK